MGGFSIAHWAIVVLAAMLLFGRDRFSDAMHDLATGLRRLRDGLADAGDGEGGEG